MNLKSPTTIILASAILGLLVVVILNSIKRKQDFSGGFTRNLKPDFTHSEMVFDLGAGSFYFAGTDSASVYLSRIGDPRRLLRLSHRLEDTSSMSISLPNERIAFGALQLRVDDIGFYGSETVSPSFLEGSMSNGKLKTQKIPPISFLSSPVRLSRSSLAVKSYDEALNKSIFNKVSKDTALNRFRVDVLERQVDGFFCTDGLLLFENKSGTMIYIYYYRNQFLALDTSMNVRYVGRTVDTVSKAHIRVAQIKSQQSFTMNAPPIIVNTKAAATSKFLFVCSVLKADNQDEASFDDASTLDVYLLQDGTYQFSFVLPSYRNLKLKEFIVQGNYVFAIYGDYVVRYTVDF